MAFSAKSPMPSYFIFRNVSPGQTSDPTTSLEFCPPKDSDELFDALRARYPHNKTHAGRMRDAVIDFLFEEKQRDQAIYQTLPSEEVPDSSPWQTSWPSVSSACSSSTFNSPKTLASATPSCDGSFSFPTPQLTRQSSTATSSVQSSQPSPRGLAQMTSCFSLSTSEQPRQRVRRRMTEAEKIEYRKRRIVKACDKCAKRKRKCQHNQPEMEVLTSRKPSPKKNTGNSSQSPTETSTAAAESQTPVTQQHFDDPSKDFGNEFMFDIGMEDFTMFDNQLPDFSLDDFIDPEYLQYPYQVNHTLPGAGVLQINSSQPEVHQTRNNDTVRYRDHFGRAEFATSAQAHAHQGDSWTTQSAGIAQAGIAQAGIAQAGSAEGETLLQTRAGVRGDRALASMANQTAWAQAQRGGAEGGSGAQTNDAPLAAPAPAGATVLGGSAQGGVASPAAPATRTRGPRTEREGWAQAATSSLAVSAPGGATSRATLEQNDNAMATCWTQLASALLVLVLMLATTLLLCMHSVPIPQISVPLLALLAVAEPGTKATADTVRAPKQPDTPLPTRGSIKLGQEYMSSIGRKGTAASSIPRPESRARRDHPAEQPGHRSPALRALRAFLRGAQSMTSLPVRRQCDASL